MKLTKKQAKEYFRMIGSIEDTYWEGINKIEDGLQRFYGQDYELAIVDGQVVGIGKITDKGRKLVIHREDA